MKLFVCKNTLLLQIMPLFITVLPCMVGRKRFKRSVFHELDLTGCCLKLCSECDKIIKVEMAKLSRPSWEFSG